MEFKGRIHLHQGISSKEIARKRHFPFNQLPFNQYLKERFPTAIFFILKLCHPEFCYSSAIRQAMSRIVVLTRIIHTIFDKFRSNTVLFFKHKIFWRSVFFFLSFRAKQQEIGYFLEIVFGIFRFRSKVWNDIFGENVGTGLVPVRDNFASEWQKAKGSEWQIGIATQSLE